VTDASVLVVMGVSGSGKTTVGRMLAQSLGWEFLDADDVHPPSNVAKMRAGEALTDEDRRPWLAALRAHIDAAHAAGRKTVIACSALTRAHRAALRAAGVRFVYLEADPAVVRARLRTRAGHFFDPDLLASQYATLEPPRDALAVSAALPPQIIADTVARALREEQRRTDDR
jgi:gluconokinase